MKTNKLRVIITFNTHLTVGSYFLHTHARTAVLRRVSQIQMHCAPRRAWGRRRLSWAAVGGPAGSACSAALESSWSCVRSGLAGSFALCPTSWSSSALFVLNDEFKIDTTVRHRGGPGAPPGLVHCGDMVHVEVSAR